MSSNQIPSTQDHLEIEDIRENFLILKNGNVSLLMQVSALNFDLLSEKEQDVKILSFANLLNSINYPMQIVIKTERTDISNYLDRLNIYKERQISEALKAQISIYMKFISNLTLNKDILDKDFYIVIPEAMNITQKTSNMRQVFGKKTKLINIKSLIDNAKNKLYAKRDHLIKQFKKIGIFAHQLNNDSLIRLFYSMYDPDKTGLSKLQLTTNEYTSSLIEVKYDK